MPRLCKNYTILLEDVCGSRNHYSLVLTGSVVRLTNAPNLVGPASSFFRHGISRLFVALCKHGVETKRILLP